MVVAAILADRFYVLTHPEMIKPQVEARLRAILDEQPPPAGLGGGFGTNANRTDGGRTSS
jgi:hypothetical protein